MSYYSLPGWRVLFTVTNSFVLRSHPGYFGKKGQRHFHYKRNQYFMPTINCDKLWTLVSEESRKASTEKKACIIDVVQAVSFFLFITKLDFRCI